MASLDKQSEAERQRVPSNIALTHQPCPDGAAPAQVGPEQRPAGKLVNTVHRGIAETQRTGRKLEREQLSGGLQRQLARVRGETIRRVKVA